MCCEPSTVTVATLAGVWSFCCGGNLPLPKLRGCCCCPPPRVEDLTTPPRIVPTNTRSFVHRTPVLLVLPRRINPFWGAGASVGVIKHWWRWGWIPLIGMSIKENRTRGVEEASYIFCIQLTCPALSTHGILYIHPAETGRPNALNAE